MCDVKADVIRKHARREGPSMDVRPLRCGRKRVDSPADRVQSYPEWPSLAWLYTVNMTLQRARFPFIAVTSTSDYDIHKVDVVG
jgi:hypothetical protein